MKKFIIKLLVIAILISNTITPLTVKGENFPTAPRIKGRAAILIDGETGRVIYSKNPDKRMYPASTTKIMTGILTLEKANLESVVTVGSIFGKFDQGSTHIALTPGENIKVEQLLYGMMLRSANDAAIVLAEHISGSVEEFAKLMNKKAQELGMKNTHFVTPNGLHSINHYTTPRDMALLAKYAMRNQKFRDIVKTYRYNIPATNKQPLRNYILNGNRLIWQNYTVNNYKYATGIKTGYTKEAGVCIVSSAMKENTELIAVVFDSDQFGIFEDSKKLFNYGFNNFAKKSVFTKDQIVTTVPIKDTGKKFNLLAQEDLKVLIGKGEENNLVTEISTEKDIYGPVKKGDALGNAIVKFNNNIIGQIKLVAAEDVKDSLLPNIKLPRFWWVFVLLLVLLIRIWYVAKKNRQRRRARRKRTTFYSKDNFNR